MIPLSACLPWQPDRTAHPVQEHRSYRTLSPGHAAALRRASFSAISSSVSRCFAEMCSKRRRPAQKPASHGLQGVTPRQTFYQQVAPPTGLGRGLGPRRSAGLREHGAERGGIGEDQTGDGSFHGRGLTGRAWFLHNRQRRQEPSTYGRLELAVCHRDVPRWSAPLRRRPCPLILSMRPTTLRSPGPRRTLRAGFPTQPRRWRGQAPSPALRSAAANRAPRGARGCACRS